MLSWPAAMLIGFGVGALCAVGAAGFVVRRHIRRVRAAERRARAAERMAEIGAMTGGLAHEIKNPLSTIGLNAQLLAEGLAELPVEEDEKGRLARRIGSLRREVDRLKGILTDFLHYAGEIRPDFRPADLNTAVEELADFFMPQAEKHGVRLRTELAPGPLTASLDVPLVKQAVLNLMLNAVQAMDGRGEGAGGAELVLRTERGAEPDKRPTVVLRVRDSGPGMDGATITRAFQPYFTTRSGGSGLGLPTARRLVEAHEGRIDVRSEPGRGTEFSLVFPADARR